MQFYEETSVTFIWQDCSFKNHLPQHSASTCSTPLRLYGGSLLISTITSSCPKKKPKKNSGAVKEELVFLWDSFQAEYWVCWQAGAALSCLLDTHQRSLEAASKHSAFFLLFFFFFKLKKGIVGRKARLRKKRFGEKNCYYSFPPTCGWFLSRMSR